MKEHIVIEYDKYDGYLDLFVLEEDYKYDYIKEDKVFFIKKNN